MSEKHGKVIKWPDWEEGKGSRTPKIRWIVWPFVRNCIPEGMGKTHGRGGGDSLHDLSVEFQQTVTSCFVASKRAWLTGN